MLPHPPQGQSQLGISQLGAKEAKSDTMYRYGTICDRCLQTDPLDIQIDSPGKHSQHCRPKPSATLVLTGRGWTVIDGIWMNTMTINSSLKPKGAPKVVRRKIKKTVEVKTNINKDK